MTEKQLLPGRVVPVPIFAAWAKGSSVQSRVQKVQLVFKDWIGEIVELKIDDVMICVAHTTNSVAKDKWF